MNPPPTPIRAIIARFMYPMSRAVIENVLRERAFDFCAIIGKESEPQFFTGLPADRQEWFVSADIRGCHYAQADWDSLAPLDAALLEGMRDTESVFMDVLTRLEWKRGIPYATRRRWYLRHLQFWNDYLIRHRINLYLSAWIPHEIPDVLLYRLCRYHGIPTLFFHTSMVQDISFGAHEWEDPAPRLREKYKEICAQFASVIRPEEIPLEPLFEERYRSLIVEKAEKPKVENVRRLTELDRIKQLFWTKPLQFCRHGIAYLSPGGFRRALGVVQRRRHIRRRNAYYDAHATEPDWDRPFVYLPLHFQPEASTTPMAGCFTDQILVAQMLNACLPDGVLIYVKEHPRESVWTKRSLHDYEDFLSLKKVRLIARAADTFALREQCRAVVTCTGSAGFEALFRQKPVLLFGSRFYQGTRGVFRIHTVEDCRTAVRAIFKEGAAPTLIDARLLMKAMQESGVRALLHPLHVQITNLSEEDHIRGNTEAILSELVLLEKERTAVSA